ncbi:MAG TPA: 30S ribosome-binding factor RbfA [Solimonas sp.]|nr:30S ribosome-binding factor RbfA [Solimonas sp.]
MKEYPRKARINAQLQAELATLIRDELSDPRVKGVTVTGVDASPDLRNAKVLVSSLEPDDKLQDAVKGLNHAAAKIRHELGKRLRLRMVPILRFVADNALREGDRIGALLNRALRDDAAHAKDRSGE